MIPHVAFSEVEEDLEMILGVRLPEVPPTFQRMRTTGVQGITDDDDLERLYAGHSEVKLKAPDMFGKR